MQICNCPKCGYDIKFYPKEGYKVSMEIRQSNEKRYCPKCHKSISYSIQKNTYSLKEA